MRLNHPKKRFIDGLFYWYRPKKTNPRGKRKKYWLWPAMASCLVIFFLGCTIIVSYTISNLSLLSLFRSGKFLILLQNNSEIRSSGGFIGSFAVVEIRNYQIKNLQFNTNIYALDRDFAKVNYVEAPAPIFKMLKGDTWALRDANYEASFPRASVDILRFYEQETNDQVDGIIALNAQTIVDLLKVIGPISLEKYNLTLTPQNFYQITQYQVEKAYYENPENWVINEPKTFLKDMYPVILGQALKNKIALLGFFQKELDHKEIIFYFKDPQKQNLVEKKNWAGEIPSDEKLKSLFKTSEFVDSLYINSNSYSGNKSSISLKQEINYQLEETEDNGAKVFKADLKISRTHGGTNVWPDGKNTEWLRIYASGQAQFVQAKLNENDISSEVEVGTDSGKNYFGVEAVTLPGETNILAIEYLIPWTPTYHLLVQKQPGVVGNELVVEVSGNVLFQGVLDRDVFL